MRGLATSDCIAAALSAALGALLIAGTPAQGADALGDCCSDLEARVADLEATTARKGNKLSR